MNGGAIDSNEPKRTILDHYETDLFGNPLQNAGERLAPPSPRNPGYIGTYTPHPHYR